jgi:hypothetical protein
VSGAINQATYVPSPVTADRFPVILSILAVHILMIRTELSECLPLLEAAVETLAGQGLSESPRDNFDLLQEAAVVIHYKITCGVYDDRNKN